MPSWSMEELIEALARYRDALVQRGPSGADADAYLIGTRRFLEWLDNDDGLAHAPSVRKPKPGAGGPGAEAMPSALQGLVERWIRDGRPRQRPAPWPRDRWVSRFPAHADYLRGLPSKLGREDLREAASGAHSDKLSAERAFITVMAWGYGKVGYGPFRTERALGTLDASGRLQRVAKALQSGGAIPGYELLGSRTDARLAGLGPAFGTKYLTFTQPPEFLPRALILDETVASWLDDQGVRLNPNVWSVRTYERYLSLMHSWASEVDISPDELEFVIFREMARRRGTQWAE